ncbi:MAG: hypothetical protein BWY69_00608 [Planctomycetes bacterium ADurb.Bin401]|nr:MAG: hypothetical protein BWY69_00608 [Planctomycetes bacterium ADurb.Bin401]
MDINKHRKVLTTKRNFISFAAVGFFHNLLNSQNLFIGLFRNRVVLIFSIKSRLIANHQIHCMLNCRDFVFIMTLWPGNTAAAVHSFPILNIEFCRFFSAVASSKTFRPYFFVFFPKFGIRWKCIHHFRTLALPFRVFIKVKKLVGKVIAVNLCTGKKSGYLLAGTCHTKDITI